MEEEFRKICQLLTSSEVNHQLGLEMLKKRPLLEQRVKDYFEPLLTIFHRQPFLEISSDVEKDSLKHLYTILKKIRLGQYNDMDFLRLCYEPVSYPFFTKEIFERRTEIRFYYKLLTYLPDFLANFQKLEVLFLQRNKFKELPEFIGKFPILKRLNLNQNKLTHLPESIGELSCLEELNISDIDLEILPDSFAKLSKLKKLTIDGNPRLKNSPNILSQLVHLEYLDIAHNEYTSLDLFITRLSKLKELFLTENKLSTLPDAIGNLKNLKVLVLHGNNLSELPQTFNQLSSLIRLQLGRNQFKKIPMMLCEMTHLEVLYLNDNKLSVFPDDFANLQNLKRLYLFNNPIAPKELKRIQTLLPNTRIFF